MLLKCTFVCRNSEAVRTVVCDANLLTPVSIVDSKDQADVWCFWTRLRPTSWRRESSAASWNLSGLGSFAPPPVFQLDCVSWLDVQKSMSDERVTRPSGMLTDFFLSLYIWFVLLRTSRREMLLCSECQCFLWRLQALPHLSKWPCNGGRSRWRSPPTQIQKGVAIFKVKG